MIGCNGLEERYDAGRRSPVACCSCGGPGGELFGHDARSL